MKTPDHLVKLLRAAIVPDAEIKKRCGRAVPDCCPACGRLGMAPGALEQGRCAACRELTDEQTAAAREANAPALAAAQETAGRNQQRRAAASGEGIALSGFPPAVQAGLDELTGDGLGGAPDRLRALAGAVEELQMDAAGGVAVQIAAVAALHGQPLKIAMQDARRMVDIAFRGDDGDTLKGHAITWERIEPSAEDVPLSRILDRLTDDYRARIYLPEGAAVVIATWIAWCYVFELSPIRPSLALTSPTKGCGKTALLDLIEQHLPRPYPDIQRHAGIVLSARRRIPPAIPAGRSGPMAARRRRRQRTGRRYAGVPECGLARRREGGAVRAGRRWMGNTRVSRRRAQGAGRHRRLSRHGD